MVTQGELLRWGNEFGQDVVRFIREEEPGTLVEYPLTAEARQRLRECVRRLSPTGGWSTAERACVAIYAVALAAEVDGEAFRSAFFETLSLPVSNQAWELVYGSAIELFLVRHFGHKPAQGPYRFVGSVFRHAGVTAKGTAAFAHFMRSLLAHSADVRRVDYDANLANVEAQLILPFLRSEAGFQFTRQTARFLAEYRFAGRPVEWLERLAGYRAGFWPRFLDAFGAAGVVRPGRKQAPEPRLCLDVDRGRLVVRFDPTWVERKAYRLGSRLVLQPDQPVRVTAASLYSVSGEDGTRAVTPWWNPSESPWALFRTSDGALAYRGGSLGDEPVGVRPDVYFYVGDEAIAPAGDDFGYLEIAESKEDYSPVIRQISVEPDVSIEILGIFGLPDHRQIPSVEFESRSGASGGMFFGALPAIRLRHWNGRAAAKYRLLHDSGAGLFELPVSPGQEHLNVHAESPARGVIRVEYRGIDYAQRPLPEVAYTLLPRWLAPELADSAVGPWDEARARLSLDEGWVADDPDRAVEDPPGQWRLPAGRSRWEPTVRAPKGFWAQLRLEIPVTRVEIGTPLEGGLLRKDLVGGLHEAPLLVSGPAWQTATVSIVSGEDEHTLLSNLRLDANGQKRMRLSSCGDRLEQCPLPVGRFVVRLADSRPLAQDLTWLHDSLVATLLGPFASQQVDEVLKRCVETFRPGASSLADALESLSTIRTREVSRVELGRIVRQAPSMAPAAAATALLALVVDGSHCDHSETELEALWLDGRAAATDPVLLLRDWWRGAGNSEPEADALFRRWQIKRVALRKSRWLATHLHEAVLAFRAAVRGAAPERSPFASESGGNALFQGAARYQAGMRESGEVRNKHLLQAAKVIDTARDSALAGSVVAALAILLRAAVRLRLGQALSLEDVERLRGEAGDLFPAAIQDLRQLARFAPEQGPLGIRLGDISPVDEDHVGRD
jgi:hypothetical protein